jgi:chorismate-pyruvate lyase
VSECPPKGAPSMLEHFRTRGYVPGGMITNGKAELFDFEALPPFLRTLLVTDGTVTKSLEAYFWEPVVIENLGQETAAIPDDVETLGMKRGETALRREVLLKGGETGCVYAYATSLLRLEALPHQVRADLLYGLIGIGEILRERGLETYREILDMGHETDAPLDDAFDGGSNGEWIYRTYRVMLSHQPAMLITEKFPSQLYARRSGLRNQV